MPRPKQNNKNTGESEEQSERTGEEFYHLRMPEYRRNRRPPKSRGLVSSVLVWSFLAA